MPLFVSLPLPGPFRYSRRIGGRRRKPGQHGTMWWLVIGWWWMPCWWLLLAMWWLCVWAYRLCRQGLAR